MSLPGYLIVVAHDAATLELFSAHHTEDEARLMYDRLATLLASTASYVHLVSVPGCEGVTAVPSASIVGPVKVGRVTLATPAVATASAPTTPEPTPFRKLTAAQFAAETEQLLANAGDGLFRDADQPLSEGGAFA